MSAGGEECDSRSTRAEPSPTSCWKTIGAASTCSRPPRRPTIRWRAFSRRSSAAAEALSTSTGELLAQGELFIHGTTHATNAIVTGNTARTAFLTTKGHPDILVLREGGRMEPFNFLVPFPKPYIPRALTFEVPERIGADGSVYEPLDEAGVLVIIEELKEKEVEAVAVSLLWVHGEPRA